MLNKNGNKKLLTVTKQSVTGSKSLKSALEFQRMKNNVHSRFHV